MAILVKKGLEYEEVVPGQKMYCRTLTQERVEKINNLGFVWCCPSSGPTVSWDDRLQELAQYYEETGKWPPQSQGQLGMWTHKQRRSYTRQHEKFMKERAPKLDAIGFEWTPRGNRKVKWDDGFEMLMAFGRIHGHYNVQEPNTGDSKGNANMLFRWVQSLHAMYRSYQLGRHPGSLTEERIALLEEKGFVFDASDV